MPAKLRPKGSLAQTSSPHFSSENGGLAMTQSNVARLSPEKNAGLRSVSPRTIWKSSTPCRNRFMRAMAEVVRFFSWPKSLPQSVRSSPPALADVWTASMSMPPVPQAGS